MKSFKNVNLGIQGDIAILRIDALPEGLEIVEPQDGQNVVAHSETGHNHSVAAGTATLYQDPSDAMVAYLVVNNSADQADLVHHRSFDPHETIRFDNGIYRINRQREHTPEGLRQVQD